MSIKNTILTSLMALGLLTGCSDDFMGDGSHTVILRLFSPATSDTRADEQAATAEEAAISSLYLAVFDTSGNRVMGLNLDAPVGGAAQTYTLDLPNGAYRFYAVANYPSVKNATTETALKSIMLTHSASQMYTPGSLPMVAYTEAAITDSNRTVLGELQFTCAKVAYNIIFDAEDEENAQALSTGLRPFFTDLGTQNLTLSTPLAYDLTKITYADADVFSLPSAGFKYYTDFTEDMSHATDASGLNCIVPGDPAGTDEASVGSATRYLWRTVVYVPERYAPTAAKRMHTDFRASYKKGATLTDTKEFAIYPGQDSGSQRNLQRGHYYEMVGHMHGYEMETTLNVMDWTNSSVSFDASHTFLWLSKANATVTTSEDDYIDFSTNADEMVIGCSKQIGGKDVVVMHRENSENTKDGRLAIRVNPAIPLTDFAGQASGTVTMSITVGNIKKYIDVTYDATPYFYVNPDELEIVYESGSTALTKVIQYTTNLGGIQAPAMSGVNSYISLNPSGSQTDGEGTVNVTALNPGTQIRMGSVTIRANQNGSTYYKTINVTIRPPRPDFRIYFRALNDNQEEWEDYGKRKTREWQGIYRESSASDQWNNDGWKNNHKLYAYYQYSENENGEIPEDKVWRFAGGWPGSDMTRAENDDKRGWYYYDLPGNTPGVNNHNSTVQYPQPGTTRLIFNSGGSSEAVHRCPHHMEPGISLYDYENQEGWIIYDPTTPSAYDVYDNQPEIWDYEYHIFIKGDRYINQIYSCYGKSNNDDGFFTLWKNTTTYSDHYPYKNGGDTDNFSWGWFEPTLSATHQNTVMTFFVRTGWNTGNVRGTETILYLKGVKGEAARNCQLKLSTGQVITLNGGKNFKNAKNSHRLGCAYDVDTQTWQEITMTCNDPYPTDNNYFKSWSNVDTNYFTNVWPW